LRIAVEFHAFGQLRAANELRKEGVGNCSAFRSCGVCIGCVWSLNAGISPSPFAQETLTYERLFWYYQGMVATKGKNPPPALPITARAGLPATYQTRIRSFAGVDLVSGDELLWAYADLYSRVQRRLFADAASGRSPASLKANYLRRYRMPARMFNAVRVSLEGKIASVREQQLLLRDELQGRISRSQEQMAQAGESAAGGRGNGCTRSNGGWGS